MDAQNAFSGSSYDAGALLQDIFDSSSSGILSMVPVMDARGQVIDFKIVAANSANERYHGQKPERLVGRGILEVFPGLVEAGLFEAYKHVAAAGENTEFEVRYDADGIHDWFNVSLVQSHGDGLTVTFSEITKQKQHQDILATLSDMGTDAERPIENVRSALLNLGLRAFGASTGFISRISGNDYQVVALSGPVEGIDIGDVLPVEDTLCASVVADNQIVAVKDLDDSNDRHPAMPATHSGAYIGVPIMLRGEVVGSIAFVTDAPKSIPYDDTSRDLLRLMANVLEYREILAQNERDREQANAQLRALVDGIPSRIWLRDSTGKIVLTNEQSLPFLEEAAAVFGDDVREIDVFERVIQQAEPDVWDVITGDEPVSNFRFQYVGPHGKTRWRRLDRVPIALDSDPNSRLIIWQDVDAEAIAEIALQETNKSLQDFAYVAAHDLQAPLRQVAMYLDILSLEIATGGQELSQEGRECLSSISRTVENMRHTVRSLYQLAALESEDIETHVQPLGDILERAISNVQAQLNDAGAQVQISHLPSLKVSTDLMVSLFQNLLTNACKYAGVPDIKINIRYEQDIGTGEHRIIFEDNGVGIDVEVRDSIFHPFSRGVKGGGIIGAGIGLSLCRKVVEMHSGSIWVDPNYSDGARFVVALPADVA